MTSRFCLAGVMGWPIAHSRSPLIHTHWLAENGLTGAYLPLAVPPDRLERAIRGLSALGFAGCNVTIPHKEAVGALVDSLDDDARRIGAVNCVVVGRDGSLRGRNTDGWGFLESVREANPTWRANAGPIAIVGAGGAARSILVALMADGAREIRLVNRTDARAGLLAEEFGAPIVAIPWRARAETLDGAAMLVNTTSQGMPGQPPLDLPIDALPYDALVCDIVYVPRETPLLRAASARGNPTSGGLGMLLHQARPSFQSWFGILPNVSAELRGKLESGLN